MSAVSEFCVGDILPTGDVITSHSKDGHPVVVNSMDGGRYAIHLTLNGYNGHGTILYHDRRAFCAECGEEYRSNASGIFNKLYLISKFSNDCN